MWKIGEFIGDAEGRLDTCIAAAGILKNHIDCLEYPSEEFEQVRHCGPPLALALTSQLHAHALPSISNR